MPVIAVETRRPITSEMNLRFKDVAAKDHHHRRNNHHSAFQARNVVDVSAEISPTFSPAPIESTNASSITLGATSGLNDTKYPTDFADTQTDVNDPTRK